MIATEDRRFRHHFGVDPVGLVRAVVDNLRAGAVVAGGSTITQQLAKNLYLTPERSLSRKLQELTLAIWLETRLDKDEILALYLNRVYLGAGAYGVEAASRRYFGKGAHDVTLAEAAMLAGLLKAPSALAPTSDLDRARERAAVVLGRMEAEGYITPAQAKAARAKPAKLAPEGETIGAWFVDWVLDGLTDHLGKPERDLVVRTTLDRRVQQATEQAVERTLAKAAVRNRVDEAAVVVLDTSGAVRAMVGGRDHRDGPFNRAVAAQPPARLGVQAVRLPRRARGGLAAGQHDRRPAGAAQGLAAGQLRRQVPRPDHALPTRSPTRSTPRPCASPRPSGRSASRPRARQLGVVSAMQPVPSIALGTSEVSLLELTGAYLPFASGGIRRPLFGVTKVEDDAGKVLYRHVPTEVRVVPPEAAAGMHELLVAAVAEGTGRAARPAGPDRRRQDRHHPERPRRLVRRLCRRLGRRRLARQRRQPADEGRAGQQPAGADLARGDAGDAAAAPRGPAADPGHEARGRRTGWSG